MRRGGDRIFRALFERGCVPQLLVDPDGGWIRDANPAAARFYGHDRDRLRALRLADLSTAPHGRVEKTLDRAMKSGENCFEDRHRGASGSSRIVEICANPVDIGGERRIFLNIRDVTTERRLRDELVKQDKLEALGVLAGGIAHDFNNQLTSILGNISLVRLRLEDQGVGGVESLLDAAEDAARRTADLTRRLHVFSRGGSPLRCPISCRTVLKDSIHHALKGSGIALELEVDPEPFTVSADPGQLGQVFGNLALNARQAMRKGGTLRIDAKDIRLDGAGPLPLEPGDYVRIRFLDEGEGIPREHLPRIFDPFFTTRKQGRGLGLAACFRIVRAHGGHITVDSEPGRGAAVAVYLPASRTAPADDLPVSTETIRGNGRVLVMDDEESVRKVTLALLRSLGYEAVGARDGHDAIEVYREGMESGSPFVAVILDLTVPGGMGGQEAAERLLAVDPDARIIASSGFSTDDVLASYRRYGFLGALPKPFRLGALSREMDRLLSLSTP